ncbi:hypothetical protein PC116_g13780 [Phytophthora cactorum]|nr:hypothetical protein PC116_g13780 [Phytophthora cactorum]
MRKGASTFCSSGSTTCPPSVAVHLRAGWSMGGVQDRYRRHDAAGDMFVGRTASGLPILQPEFASLPPHFVHGEEVVQKAKRICFPNLPEAVEFVGEFALAPLIYHLDLLREYLPGNHPLFQSPLFAASELVNQLRSYIRTDSRIELKNEIEARKADVQTIMESHDAMCERLCAEVSTILEERVVQTGIPTCDSMASSIMKRLEDAGVLQHLHTHEETEGNTPNTASETAIQSGEEVEAVTEPVYPIYHWGGGMHMFPLNV